MSITVKKVTLSEQHTHEDQQQLDTQFRHTFDLGFLGDIEVQCTVRVGTFNLTVSQFKHLQLGCEVQLEHKTDDPVEIVLNNRIIARGELMSHEDHFAVHITEISS